jgi:lipopolysaccharide transport system ATP-binding protein
MGSITVSNLGKAYRQYTSRWARLVEWVDPVSRPRHHQKWVLRDINFAVQPGEAVGILGVNGAGKSTLLKILTGTTEPTTGNVLVKGRVAALLELGMGFHPDFSGRQNALMAGQLQGLSVEAIQGLMPEIEEFAGVGEYFDQPLRVYSSGMQVRVAFAVATAVKPEILIVDEALSVGDIAFQAKCMERMRQFIESGVTVILVSHAVNQVRQFCGTALYLSGGRIKAFGPAEDVCDLYQNDMVGGGKATSVSSKAGGNNEINLLPDPALRANSAGLGGGGTLDLEYLWLKLMNNDGVEVSSFKHREKVIFEACVRANRDVESGANAGLLLADKSGYHLVACNTNYYDKYIPALRAGDFVLIRWEFLMPFSNGEFRVDVGLKPEPFSQIFFDRVFCAKIFTVPVDVELLKRNYGGYIYLDALVEVRKLTVFCEY